MEPDTIRDCTTCEFKNLEYKLEPCASCQEYSPIPNAPQHVPGRTEYTNWRPAKVAA